MGEKVSAEFFNYLSGQRLGIEVFVVSLGENDHPGQEQEAQEQVGQEHQNDPLFAVLVVKLAHPREDKGREQKGDDDLPHA